MNDDHYKAGRGAQVNPANRFDNLSDKQETFLDVNQTFEHETIKTQFLQTHAKSIVNKVTSPDIGMEWSMNPYQGCEHGCVYCYARNTHSYWGYSAGLDFESKILIKDNAPDLLRKKLSSKNWQAAPIMFSGNTDCYQPIERKLGITRKMLEILWEFRHPVGIITKNSLVLRDLDILSKMAGHNLVKVSMSINGQDEKLRELLEPRTATYKKRLRVVKDLSEAGIPVNVMLAPIIPGLNDHEVLGTIKAAAEAGARSVGHILIRLNGDVREIFEDWLRKNFPDRASKVLNKISAVHGGQTNDSQFGRRMKGEGTYADIIRDQVKLGRMQYLKGLSMPEFNTELYHSWKDKQMTLF